MWLYIDDENRVLAYNEQESMDGNTGWIEYDGTLPSTQLTDDHGAAMYELFDGTILERPLSERMKDWEPDPEETREPTEEERLRADVDYIMAMEGLL